MLKCGIIIVNFNEYLVTEKLLNRIKDAPEVDHIIIVDNCSTDDSFEQLAKYQNEKITLLQSGWDGGYSCGNNFGARYLIEKFHPDIIGIANPDTEFDGAFVGKIKQIFAEYPDYAMITGLMSNHTRGNFSVNFFEDESTPLAFIGSLCHELFIRPFMNISRKIFRRNVMEPERNYTRLQEIMHSPCELNQVWGVGGSLFFIRSEDFEAAGMFDENVFLYYEEHILAYKINRRLWRKAGIINTIDYVHDHRTPKDDTPLDKLNRGMNSLKYHDASSMYYFSTYVTGSRTLWAVYALLIKLRRLKSYTGYYFRRLMLKISRKQ